MQPPDGTDASGYARGPVADADRERAIDVLKDAFAEGRLTGDEHAERVERAYGSRTDAELAAVSGDLPAGPPGTPPSQARPRPAGYLLRPAARTNPLAIASLACGLADRRRPGSGPRRPGQSGGPAAAPAHQYPPGGRLPVPRWQALIG